jgi:hypothetical protein
MDDVMTADKWEDDSIQFPRLIAEIQSCVAINDADWETMLESMDLTNDQLVELFDRADAAWERIKADLP